MASVRLKPATKIVLTLLLVGGSYAVYRYVVRDRLTRTTVATGPQRAGGPASAPAAAPAGHRPYKIALSEWPGHMPFVIGNGGLTTQPGSAAAQEGLQLEVVFIEDPVKKNAALQSQRVDFVWQVVDEMPLNMGGYKRARVDAKAFLQLDWSRGGDACVAAAEITKVEDLLGHKSAMMMFSPDHTVFEFMINNSRLTPAQVDQVRKATSFSMDDFTYGRILFTQKKVDVACLWEPDVSLALRGRPGAHRLFSTADATELVADVLLTTETLLTKDPELAAKVARVWFAGVKQALGDKPAAAKLISTVVPRFRSELGYAGTLKAFDWVKWTDAADNARFFGLTGEAPAFDRVYNQADAIWTRYPEAKIAERFVPAGLRHDGIVRQAWEAVGRATEEQKPKYEPKTAAVGAPVLTKPVTINFATAQSALDPESMHIINTQVIPQLQMARAMLVRVEGNTDSVGNAKANRGLSEQRARAVREYIVTRGIEGTRIHAKGNGDQNPVASNKTTEGRAANRRTDVLYIRGAQQ